MMAIENQDEHDVSIPNTLSMKNYPNPFNPTTTIILSLPKASNVQLDIYNIKGQKVKTLLNEVMLPGSHNVTWDGKDNCNKKVASGVYLYKFQTDKKTIINKMLLLK